MINRLETRRKPETKEKIRETLLKKYKDQGGMREEIKRKISLKMKKNWELKKQEELNKDQKPGKNE